MTIAVANDTIGNPVRAPIANRAFGIELEVIYQNRYMSHAEVAAHIERETGIRCRNEGYGHGAVSAWKVTHDGSVSGGGEVVSPKLVGEDGIAQAVKVTKALQSLGCKVEKSCGFHVHVDASDITAKELAKVGICFAWFETFFDHIMPASRRGNESIYVKSNRGFYGDYGTQALNASIAAINAAAITGDMLKVTRAINPRCNCYTQERGQRCSCSGRYAKLNATPINNQKSLEFRQHSGTIEHEKVENWIRLCVQFVEKGKRSQPRSRTNIREWTAAEEMHLFFSMFGIDRTIATYYMERRKTIKAQDAARALVEAEQERLRQIQIAAETERRRLEAIAWEAGAAERNRLAAERQAQRDREYAERNAARAIRDEAERLANESRIAGLFPFAHALRDAMNANHATLLASLDGAWSQIRSGRASRINRSITSLNLHIQQGEAWSINRLADNALRRHYVTAAAWRRIVHLRPAA